MSGYYRLEDPTRFDPESCEQRVEVELADGTLLRGFVDRIDVAATGEMRVVDYKTGKAPPEARALAEFKAMFQMKFYAVALLRSRGVLPARLRLLYLADGQVLDYSPDLDELERFEKTLIAIWRAIQSAGATGDFRPTPVADVRLVRTPRALPGVRRDAAAVSGLAGASRRRRRGRRAVLGARCVSTPHYRAYIALRLYRHGAILDAWTCSRRSPNPAGAPCSTPSPEVSEQRANSSPRCPG